MAELTYSVNNGLIKLALLMMYCRIFTFRKVRWAVLTTGFLSVCLVLSGIILPLVQCRPIERTWNHSVPGVPTSLIPSLSCFFSPTHAFRLVLILMAVADVHLHTL